MAVQSCLMKNSFRDEGPFGAINLCDECLHCSMNMKHQVPSSIKSDCVDSEKEFSLLKIKVKNLVIGENFKNQKLN